MAAMWISSCHSFVKSDRTDPTPPTALNISVVKYMVAPNNPIAGEPVKPTSVTRLQTGAIHFTSQY